MNVECPKCGSGEMSVTNYKEDGRVVETSYTCKQCNTHTGVLSYGIWQGNEDYEIKELDDLNDEQSAELEGYIEEFITIRAYIENFIHRNNLDEDDVWEKINEDYEESMSRQHG